MVVLVLNILLLLFYGIRLKGSSLNSSAQRFLFLAIAFLHLSFMHIFFNTASFPDLPGYNTYFNSMSNPQPFVHLEIGWYFLNRILHGISHNSFILIFSVSIIMIICYLITIDRYSAIPWLSVFLILCTVFYNSLFVLRQHLAIPVCLLSIPYIVEQKPIKFAILTLVAVSFHYSALVWFLAYFIYPIKINIGFYFMMIIISVLLYFLMEIILKNLIMLTPKIMAYTISNKSGGTGVLKILAVNISAFLLCLYCFRNTDQITGYNKLFFQLIIITIFLNILEYIGTSFALFGRLNLYFSVTGILLIPNALVQITNKKIYYVLTLVICIFYLLFLNHMVQYGYEIKL
jgi:hypothetical protein